MSLGSETRAETGVVAVDAVRPLSGLEFMTALADEIPITEIADQLCRRVEEIAPDVVSSLLHIDAEGLVHPLGGSSLPDDYSRALDGVAIGPDIGYYLKSALPDPATRLPLVGELVAAAPPLRNAARKRLTVTGCKPKATAIWRSARGRTSHNWVTSMRSVALSSQW